MSRAETGAPPRPQLVPQYGYVSLFPLLMRLIPPASPVLGRQLELLRDPHHLWTDYGLRSLRWATRGPMVWRLAAVQCAGHLTHLYPPPWPPPHPLSPQPVCQPVRRAQHGARPAVLAGGSVGECQLSGSTGSPLGRLRALCCRTIWRQAGSWSRSSLPPPRRPPSPAPPMQALRHYGATPGPHAAAAEALHQELRANLLRTIAGQYEATGYLWEQYDDAMGGWGGGLVTGVCGRACAEPGWLRHGTVPRLQRSPRILPRLQARARAATRSRAGPRCLPCWPMTRDVAWLHVGTRPHAHHSPLFVAQVLQYCAAQRLSCSSPVIEHSQGKGRGRERERQAKNKPTPPSLIARPRARVRAPVAPASWR